MAPDVIRTQPRLHVADQLVNDVTTAAEELGAKHTLPHQLTILSTRIIASPEEQKPVVLYLISTTLENGNVAHIERRYREFEQVDSLLKSAFSNSHLRSSFPKLTGKQSLVAMYFFIVCFTTP